MSQIEIGFRCGHKLRVAPAAVPDRPQCQQCKNNRIAYVTAPRPTFRGAVRGPCVIEDKR